MGKILAFVDGSAYTSSVCDYARWVATRGEHDVEVAHVLGRREVPEGPTDLSGSLGLGGRTALLQELAELDARRAKLAYENGQALLADAAIRIRGGHPTETSPQAPENRRVPTTTKLRRGDLVEAMHQLETDSRLVVIGKRGQATEFARGHLGSNLERVVRASGLPVLVCPPEFLPIRRLLLAFDGGKSATKALNRIATSPVFDELEIRVLVVGRDNRESQERVRAATERFADSRPRATVERLAGDPDDVIAGAFQDSADLLVMGAYGHSRIRSLLIGSTTTSMIRACQRPVLLFR